MRKSKLLLLRIILAIFLAIMFYFPVRSAFDGVKKVPFSVPPSEVNKNSNHFLTDHKFYQLAFSICQNYNQSAERCILEMYEDEEYYYFIDSKLYPVSSLWSYYVKKNGFCLRKKDGCVKLNGTQCWVPIENILKCARAAEPHF